MALRYFRSWSITARLVTIATVPAIVMGGAVTAALYVGGIAEVTADLQERGRLASAMLVEASRYGLVSGNTAALQATMGSMLRNTPGVAAVEILSPDHRLLVSAGEPDASTSLPAFELEVAPGVPDINLFDQSGGGPHVSAAPSTEPHFRTGQIVGYVRVTMSPVPLIEAKRERLALGAMIVLVATLVSVAGGIVFAQVLLRTPLRSVTDALQGLRSGAYQVELDMSTHGEMGELNRTIVEVARTLGVTYAELERQVELRTAELQQALEERRRLIASGNAVLEEERERIAREIHDHLNAELIVLRMEINNATDLASRLAEPEAQARFEDIFTRINKTTKRLYTTARRIVKQLRPEVIDTLGLEGAVREMVRNYDMLHPGCSFSLEVGDHFPPLRGQQAITAYRMVQEALSNVVKHARATSAAVRLLHLPGGTPTIRIVVADNGLGFHPKADSAGVGIIGMRERAAASGGTMTIQSPGSKARPGTTITIQLPLEPVGDGSPRLGESIALSQPDDRSGNSSASNAAGGSSE